MPHQTLQCYHPESFVMFLKPVLKYLSTAVRAYRCCDKGALQQFQADMSKSFVHINDRKIQFKNQYLPFLFCCVVSSNLRYLLKVLLILLNMSSQQHVRPIKISLTEAYQRSTGCMLHKNR